LRDVVCQEDFGIRNEEWQDFTTTVTVHFKYAKIMVRKETLGDLCSWLKANFSLPREYKVYMEERELPTFYRFGSDVDVQIKERASANLALGYPKGKHEERRQDLIGVYSVKSKDFPQVNFEVEAPPIEVECRIRERMWEQYQIEDIRYELWQGNHLYRSDKCPWGKGAFEVKKSRRGDSRPYIQEDVEIEVELIFQGEPQFFAVRRISVERAVREVMRRQYGVMDGEYSIRCNSEMLTMAHLTGLRAIVRIVMKLRGE
jgi:hypothetical protein